MNKTIATEEYLTSVMIIIEKKEFLFCKPTIFNLLVVVMKTKTKKRKKMIYAGFIK